MLGFITVLGAPLWRYLGPVALTFDRVGPRSLVVKEAALGSAVAYMPCLGDG